jgi:hypothetical protein
VRVSEEARLLHLATGDRTINSSARLRFVTRRRRPPPVPVDACVPLPLPLVLFPRFLVTRTVQDLGVLLRGRGDCHFDWEEVRAICLV